MPREDIVRHIASLLAGRNLTLYRVSQITRRIYGRVSPYFIPHNYYSELRQESFSPSIYQLVALSRVSGYRLEDWLGLFAINVHNIFDLQVRLPSARTKLLDAKLDADRFFPKLKEREPGREWPTLAPLSQLAALDGSHTAGAHLRDLRRDFLYAKTGYEDAMSFPGIAPGSIVRADPKMKHRIFMQELGTTSKSFFLVEYGRGHLICRLRRTGADAFSTVSSHLPYPEVELTVPKDARILGVVDLEVRSTLRSLLPRLPLKPWQHRAVRLPETSLTLAKTIRAGRGNMNLSLPAASRLSHETSRILGDPRYSMSISSLSDYEAAGDAPRHIHKLVSLCAVYGLGFFPVLKTLGIALETCGVDPMPGTFPRQQNAHTRPSGQLKLAAELSDLPLLVSGSLTYLAGIPALSLRDFFWTGGQRESLHPALQDSLLALVNRRRKRPLPQLTNDYFDQQIFLMLKRDGTYVAGLTTLDQGVLTVHGIPQHRHRPLRLRNRDEAEVIGQIVVVLRKVN